MKHPGRILCLIVLLAIIQRTVYAAFVVQLPYDSGTVALMALHILDGNFPLFLYGFPDSGAFTAYCTALCFALFGPSLAALHLTPILFTVGWVIFAYLLFRELLDTRVALAAAACVAMPDWVTTHFTTAPYCIQTPLFCLGTAVLWLAARIGFRDELPSRLWLNAFALGTIGGVGLWVHPTFAVYLLCAAAMVMPAFIREWFRTDLIRPFLAGELMLLLGLATYFFTPEIPGGGGDSNWTLKFPALLAKFKQIWQTQLPIIYTWPVDLPRALIIALPVLLAAGGLLWAWRLFSRADRSTGYHPAFPFLFCMIFLLMYVPHRVATEGGARFLLPFWMMIVWASFAVPLSSTQRGLRRVTTLFLAAWLIYNGASIVVNAAHQSPRRTAKLESYQQMIKHASDANADAVVLVGPYSFTAQGQNLRYFCRDTIPFIAAGIERDVRTAEAVERVGQPVLAVPAGQRRALEGALDSVGADYFLQHETWASLAYDIRAAPAIRRSIPPCEMTVFLYGQLFGGPPDLLDRNRASYVNGRTHQGTALLVDLGADRLIDGVTLAALRPNLPDLPGGLLLEGSMDGVTFHELSRLDDALSVRYVAGQTVYLEGGYGWMECRFAPEVARYLRFTVINGRDDRPVWRATELFIFEHVRESDVDLEAEAGRIAQRLQDEGIEFTACDRWLSARLRQQLGPAAAYPLFNDHLRFSVSGRRAPLRKVQPGPKTAIVVDGSLREEAEQVLRAMYGENFSWQVVSYDMYALFLFEKTPPKDLPDPHWSGFTILQ